MDKPSSLVNIEVLKVICGKTCKVDDVLTWFLRSQHFLDDLRLPVESILSISYVRYVFCYLKYII